MADTTNENGVTFAEWLKAIDAILTNKTGMTHSDFADSPYWDNWANGVSPAEMVTVIAEYDEILEMFLLNGEEV